jgi:glucose/arabinose dehydrogenase
MHLPSWTRRAVACGLGLALIGVAALGAPLDALSSASGHALRFYGTGAGQQDRVRIPIDDDAPGADASSPCDVGGGSFTIDLWMRGRAADNPSAGGGGDREWSDFRWIDGNIILDRDIWGGSEAKYGISIAGGRVRFGTGRGADGSDSQNTIEGSIDVLDDAWHHVAVVRDASTGRKRIYVDGLLDFESSAGASRADLSYPDAGVPGQLTPWGPFIVLAAEKHDAGPEYPSFDGFIDELRIWSVALSAERILAVHDRVLPSGEPGLVGYYRFEEGSGTAVADSSGAGSPAGELIAGVPGNGEWAAAAAGEANVAPVSSGPLPVGFRRSPVVEGLSAPVALEFTPDGRLLVASVYGSIFVIENGALLPEPLIGIPANTDVGERGLVGLALDPSFASNGHFYVYYTTFAPRNRVSRFTAAGNRAELSSELVIWENPELAAVYHHGGGLGVGPDGRLYISTGDQFDAANAQDLGTAHGKILRLGLDGSLPPDNPFLGTPGARPEIWARGLRNPFRIAFDPQGGALWIGDVGGNVPTSSEEVNRGVRGANYGWPDQEGESCYISSCVAFQPAAFSYAHEDPDYYRNAVQASITLGPVYRGLQFPAAYRGNVFFGDYANRWIRRLVLDASGNAVGAPIFLESPEAGTVVDLDVGPDGALYYVTLGNTCCGFPGDVGGVYRIERLGGSNAPPSARSSAAPTAGPAPLAVEFSSAGSTDPDGGPEPLSFAWDFGDGEGSALANPSHVYARAGRYSARLTVTDGAESSTAPAIDIVVGSPPDAAIIEPAEGLLYRAGDAIVFSGTASDLEDGVLAASAYSWEVLLGHLEHQHPFAGPILGVTGGSFEIPSSGHSPDHTYFEIRLTVTDSDGLTRQVSRIVRPLVSLLSVDTLPSGIPVFIDGQPATTPAAIESIPGFRHQIEAQAAFTQGGIVYGFGCWTDGGERVRALTMTEGGLALVASYVPSEDSATVTAVVEAEERNADYSPIAGERFWNNFDVNGLCAGRDGSGEYQAGAEFRLDVPRAARILSAYLEVVATADQKGSPRAELRAYDAASAAAFDATHSHALTAHQALGAAMVLWDFEDFTPGGVYRSPDLSILIQAVVDRADWTGGNHVGIVLDGAANAAGNWRCFRNFTSGQPPRLAVVYAVPASGGGDCGPAGSRRGWKRCDFNCDGRQDISDSLAGLGYLFLSAPPPCCRALADCNGDSIGDISDWVFLLLHLFSGGAPAPAPFPDCGVVPDEDCPAYPHCPDLPAE